MSSTPGAATSTATGPALATASPTAAPTDEGPRLAGDLTIWAVIALELATFGLLFLAFAAMRARHAAAFGADQAQLELSAGALNTAWLVLGSGSVARAVQAAQQGRSSRQVAAWLGAALLFGAAFMVLKTTEFLHHAAAGRDLSNNDFWMFYWLLAGFHWMHVAAAMVFLAVLTGLALRGGRSPGGGPSLHALETGAAFWHMVDLLWLVLFPLVYVPW